MLAAATGAVEMRVRVAIGAAAMPAAMVGAAREAIGSARALRYNALTMSCAFCEKLNRLHELSAEEVVWLFPKSVALLGPWQYHTGYCVLVAREHATELHQLPASERHAYFDEMTLLAHAIEVCFRPRKLNYELLGNQVPHLHWHLFPRRPDDPEVQKPVWLALDRAERDEAERSRLQSAAWPRDEITRRLKEQLRSMQAKSL
jgi:diadenosine tetraphosphate (Ap4A) HIT family hydrolase